MILNISIKNWKLTFLDFPGGPVVKSLPANAGDTSWIPGLGRFYIPHGNWTCAPQRLKPLSFRAWTPQPESSPYSLQLEKVHAQQWRPSTVKIINNFLKRIEQVLNFFIRLCQHPDCQAHLGEELLEGVPSPPFWTFYNIKYFKKIN